jgi:hypothetical protein
MSHFRWTNQSKQRWDTAACQRLLTLAEGPYNALRALISPLFSTISSSRRCAPLSDFPVVALVGMHISVLVGVLLPCLVVQCVAAAAVAPRQQGVPGVIQAPMWRRDGTRSVEADILRRDHLQRRQTVSVPLPGASNKLLYFANSTSCSSNSILTYSHHRHARPETRSANRHWVERYLGRST